MNQYSNAQTSFEGVNVKPTRKREAKRNSPPGENEAKPEASGSDEKGRKNKNTETRRARSVCELPSDQQSARNDRSRSADLSGDSAGFIRTKPKKANILMMKDYSFEITKEAFQAQALKDMKRADHPFVLKFRPGEGGKAIKVAGPDYAWEWKNYLPKNFTDNIPKEMKVLEEDHGLGLRNILSREQCQRLDDYLCTEFAQIFGDCSLSTKKGSRPFIDDPIPQVRALNASAQQVIEQQVAKKLEQEKHFRKRSQIVPNYDFIKAAHNPVQHFFDVHVINKDCDAFVRDLEHVAWKMDNQKIDDGFEIRDIKNPLHTAAELCRYQFLQQLFNFLQTAERSARQLVSNWMNEQNDSHMLPFQTALLTDFPDRFKMAELLLCNVNLRNLKELLYKPRNRANPYRESALDLVILTGNSDFTRYYMRKMPEMTQQLKTSALLSIVCTGDTHLLLDIWNAPPHISPTAFCMSTAGEAYGDAGESPFLTAIDRNDINMVKTILDIHPSAADTVDNMHGFLPYQYAMLVDAEQELVDLLRGKCRLPFELNGGPVQLLRIMGASLRSKCRPLYDEAMNMIWQYRHEIHFNLPGLLRYAIVSQLYDVVENILNFCITNENLKRNMHEELIRFYAFLLSSRNIDNIMFDKLHSLLHENGINMELVMEYLKEEHKRMKAETSKTDSLFKRPYPTRRAAAIKNQARRPANKMQQ